MLYLGGLYLHVIVLNRANELNDIYILLAFGHCLTGWPNKHI